jgi:hypothetical protein
MIIYSPCDDTMDIWHQQNTLAKDAIRKHGSRRQGAPLLDRPAGVISAASTALAPARIVVMNMTIDTLSARFQALA